MPRKNGKPAAAREPQFHTTLGKSSTSTPGRYKGLTLEQTIAEAKRDLVSTEQDVSVWDGDRLLAVIRPSETGGDLDVIRLDRLAPRTRRYSNQRPMLRQSITFNPPWSPDCPLTIEIILLPEGSGDGINEADSERHGCPLTKHDLTVLEEAGWLEWMETGVTAYVRFVR